MKYFLITILPLFFLSACDFKSKPYLKHEMKFEKIAGDCSQATGKVDIEANTIGERYVFNECLDAGFKGDYVVERRGDTVEVKMDRTSDKTALYKITLDINTRPAYHFLIINGTMIGVNVTRD